MTIRDPMAVAQNVMARIQKGAFLTVAADQVLNLIVKTPMDPALMAGDLADLYPEKDYHTLYFGEILSCYPTD